jgi:hypothetical protein
VVQTVLEPDKLSCGGTAYSSDGSRLAALGVISGKVEIYSTGDWKLLRRYDNSTGWGRGQGFYAVSFIPGTLTLALGAGKFAPRGNFNPMDGLIYFFQPEDLEPSRQLHVYQYDEYLGLPGAVESLAFSKGGQRVATSTSTGLGPTPGNSVNFAVHILNVADGHTIGSPLDYKRYGKAGGLKYSADGRYLITGHRDVRKPPIHILDATTSQIVDEVPAGGVVWDITVNPHGEEFAAGVDKSIVIWSLPELKPERRL